MVYDRVAIRAGELWRLITGNWVHFSGSHLGYNLLALGFAGWLIESRGHPHFALLSLLSATVIGVAVLSFESGIQFYGGLSGVATGAIVYLALREARNGTLHQIVLAIVLVLLGLKLGWESFVGQPLFARATDSSCVVVPISHLAGALTAGALSGVCELRDWLQTRLHLEWT
jgi:rhomboid family GlyGly-CTERM serine protease